MPVKRYGSFLSVLVKQKKKRGQVNNDSCEAQSQNDRHAVGIRLKRLDVSASLQSFVHTHHEYQSNPRCTKSQGLKKRGTPRNHPGHREWKKYTIRTLACYVVK